MSAGLAVLTYLRDNPDVYETIDQTTQELHKGFNEICEEIGKSYTVNRIGSMISLFFTEEKVIDMTSAKACDTSLFGRYFRGMLEHQVYLAPSQFEALFISAALSDSDVDHILSSARDVLKALH
jgi:glutamate-1-semialdehyde 2,1-aminomutase